MSTTEDATCGCCLLVREYNTIVIAITDEGAIVEGIDRLASIPVEPAARINRINDKVAASRIAKVVVTCIFDWAVCHCSNSSRGRRCTG